MLENIIITVEAEQTTQWKAVSQKQHIRFVSSNCYISI